MSRSRALSLALAGVIGSGAVGWLAGTRVQSSNDAAAAARPPAAGPITAAVERAQLSADIVTRGTARYGHPVPVSLPGPGVVTRAPETGVTVDDGTPFMEVNGLPVFALTGEKPSFRDLGPGDSGNDVAQLERALERLGFSPGDVDGVYDADTSRAVERWYAANGYAAVGPSDAELADLRAASAAVRQAETALAAARRQLATGTEPPSASERFQAESEVARAEDALADARLARDDANRTAQRTVADRENALAEARAQALVDAEEARRNVDDKAMAAELARASLGGESAFEDDRVARLQAEQTARRADRELADARTQLQHQPAKSQAAIDNAAIALEDALAALPRTSADGEAKVRAAEATLSLARTRLSELLAPRTAESLAAAVGDAEISLVAARADLAQLEAGIGVKLPAGSVVYFLSLPLRVDSVATERGDAASGEVMTVSGSELVVETAVTIAEAKLLAAGMDVAIEAPDLGLALAGKVLRIASKPGTGGVSNQHVFVEIAPVDPPASLRDAAVRVTIPVRSTAGAVLVVPVAAVSSDAAGNARVDVSGTDGAIREVRVAAGLSSGGRIEVTPLDGSLAEGDRVVVGAR